jgi:hypothetical protein
MPATLAETIKIADSYALGDPLQPTLALQGQGQNQRNNNGARASGLDDILAGRACNIPRFYQILGEFFLL